ncbi:MAG TPA: 2OG-Fe(II) oxygenase [Stellaceae bacterium]|jgi:predicted 2-oxoglutarate/Fe(II)-dependent dioxygenase YbiX/peroxiredoxin
MDQSISANVRLGDPAPWFSAPTVAGGSADLHVSGGRWIVISFLGDLATPHAETECRSLIGCIAGMGEDHLVAYAVLTAPPVDPIAVVGAAPATLRYVADYDGAVTRLYGATGAPRSVVLDPMLRVVAIIPWDHPAGHAAILQQMLKSLPSVDDSAGVPMMAPALIVPRVLDFDLCDFLARLYDKMGGDDSGFLLDVEGKTRTIVNYRLKRRRDLPIVVPELRERIRDQLVRRLLPAIERYFQFTATRMDRYLVSCYDAAEGGHFFRHRDNINAGAQHRRFAVSINLNRDYDGCDLMFPEFGRRIYRAPVGGAVVFSCGALHEVTPITRGRRYAFLPFLYGEADAALRAKNNALIEEGSARYQEGDDLLYPAGAAAASQAHAA